MLHLPCISVSGMSICCFDVRICHGPLTRYVKLRGGACAGNSENVFPATDFKANHQLTITACITYVTARCDCYLTRSPWASFHMTATHVPWCMPRSLTRAGGENVPGIPGACTIRNFTYLARGPWANIREPLANNLEYTGFYSLYFWHDSAYKANLYCILDFEIHWWS